MNDKVQNSIKLLNDMEYVIDLMVSEIEQLRYMVYRYQLKHGNEVQGGKVELSEDVSFLIRNSDINENAVIIKTDLTITNYKRIKEYLTKIK